MPLLNRKYIYKRTQPACGFLTGCKNINLIIVWIQREPLLNLTLNLQSKYKNPGLNQAFNKL